MKFLDGLLGADFPEGHFTVTHSIGEYVRGGATVNRCENYFSVLKRGINGVYQHVSSTHLKRYVGGRQTAPWATFSVRCAMLGHEDARTQTTDDARGRRHRTARGRVGAVRAHCFDAVVKRPVTAAPSLRYPGRCQPTQERKPGQGNWKNVHNSDFGSSVLKPLTHSVTSTTDTLQYFDGMQVRAATYDHQIVLESKKYLALNPMRGDIVVDVGANIGAATKHFIDCGVTKVIAVEPEIENFRLLTINTASYEHRVHILNAGVAHASGPRILWVNTKKNRGMNSLIWSPRRHAALIDCISFSSLLQLYSPTLLKIDIEGAEYELSHQICSLPQSVRGIAMEMHFQLPRWRSFDAPLLVDALKTQGFEAVMRPKISGMHLCTLGIWLREI